MAPGAPGLPWVERGARGHASAGPNVSRPGGARWRVGCDLETLGCSTPPRPPAIPARANGQRGHLRAPRAQWPARGILWARPGNPARSGGPPQTGSAAHVARGAPVGRSRDGAPVAVAAGGGGAGGPHWATGPRQRRLLRIGAGQRGE